MSDIAGMSAKKLLGYYQEKLDEEARQAKKKGNLFAGLHPLLHQNSVLPWI